MGTLFIKYIWHFSKVIRGYVASNCLTLHQFNSLAGGWSLRKSSEFQPGSGPAYWGIIGVGDKDLSTQPVVLGKYRPPVWTIPGRISLRGLTIVIPGQITLEIINGWTINLLCLFMSALIACSDCGLLRQNVSGWEAIFCEVILPVMPCCCISMKFWCVI